MYKLNTVKKNIIVDTITPVSIYLKLRDNYSNTILLESSDYSAKDNSYAYICCNPIAKFYVKKNTLFTEYPDGSKFQKEVAKDIRIFSELEKFMNKFSIQDDSNQSKKYISKGLFGYMTYDSVRFFEKININNESFGDDIPDIYYSLYSEIIVVNTFNNEANLISHSGNKNKIDEIEKLIKGKKTNEFSFKLNGKLESNLTDDEFLKMVDNGIKHCYRGDVFQIVLSRKFSQKFSGDEFCVYRQLRSINPSPYLFYFDYGSFKIFGSSPEAQLVIKDKKAEIHPIAGTFKRSGDDAVDKEKAIKLFEDDKENSEHMMLVDLARNDLSKVCNPGSVQVDEMMIVEKYSHVMHMTSNVIGEKKESVSSVDCMTAALPAGTLSGAPKIRAMEILHDIENRNRGIYGGSVGYFGFNGSLDTAIVIRTALHTDKSLTVGVGGGIVHDSIPENEWNETEAKLAVFLEALKYE